MGEEACGNDETAGGWGRGIAVGCGRLWCAEYNIIRDAQRCSAPCILCATRCAQPVCGRLLPAEAVLLS